VPDKFNPFRPDKIAPPGIFAGRIEEIRAIDHCLLQTKNGNPQHFLLIGERGIGKSSLFVLEQQVASGNLATFNTDQKLDFIVVSISIVDEDDQYSLIRKILTELRKELLKRDSFKAFALAAWNFITKIEAAGVRFNRDDKRPDESELLSHLLNDFVRLLSSLPDGTDGVLLLIDEADKGPSANLGLICKHLTEEITRRQCERLCVGCAGLPPVLQILKDSHESSLRIFKTMNLRPLEVEERKQVIISALNKASEKNGRPITIDDNALKLLCNLSEGYPHFLQEFAYAAFEEDDDDRITFSDISECLFKENGPFDQLGRKFFGVYYALPSSADYRTVLQTMSNHLDKWVDRATIIAESGLKAATVDNALRALKPKNIILWDKSKPGNYRLPNQAFAIWLRARELAKTLPKEGEPTLFWGVQPKE
jgi:hypothetical protein